MTPRMETESLRHAVKPVGSAAVPRLHSDYPFHLELSRIVSGLLKDPTYINVPSNLSQEELFLLACAQSRQHLQTSPFR